jgi:exodeoxyribonuclease V beta subunit
VPYALPLVDGGGEWNRLRRLGIIPKIQGMLNGSIDLVLRDRRDRATRYFVADYKSNQLWGPDSSREITRSWPLAEPPPGPPRDVLRRWHYTEGNMAWGMAHTGYHLQALLYTVAVHRWLKLRVPGYTYREHFGGHFYLFLRGMEGAAGVGADGQVRGVWHDRWPEATVIGLDLALTGASADDVQRATEGVSR